LAVALADPFDIGGVSALERAVGRRIVLVGAPREKIHELIGRVYRNGARREAPAERAPEQAAAPISFGAGGADDPPTGAETGGTTARIVDEVLERGIALGATDIHIE